MRNNSWTRRFARICVRPLLGGPVMPNHITTIRLITGLAACAAFAAGVRLWDVWGGILWLLSTFLDRTDGEFARMSGRTGRFGHLYDYTGDVVVNSLFFLSIGIGLRDGALGGWAVVMGAFACAAVAATSILAERLERRLGNGKKAYPGAFGFDFDDVMYLFAPIAWLDALLPLLIGAAIGGPVFLIIVWVRLRRSQRISVAGRS